MKKKAYISPKMDVAIYRMLNTIMKTSIGKDDYLPLEPAPAKREEPF